MKGLVIGIDGIWTAPAALRWAVEAQDLPTTGR